MIGKMQPILHTDSKLRIRLASIFQVSSQEYVTPIEFVLSLAVLYRRATFLKSEELAYDILYQCETGILDTSIFSDLPKYNDADILFHVEYPGGKVDITRTLFILGWKRFLTMFKINNMISREEFTEMLGNSSSGTILLFPFCINTPLEALI